MGGLIFIPSKKEKLRKIMINIEFTRKFAAEIRYQTIKEIVNLGFGHIGGAMSIIETLAVLYGGVMKIDPRNPDWGERDWLVCSKGHAGPALYATLALKGYFPLEMLLTLNRGGTSLPSHCDRNKTPGIDMTTGSLGQGLSCGVGMAIGLKHLNMNSRVFVLVGDGELQEGQIWEAATSAVKYKLDNLIAIVDNNGIQNDGFTNDIMPVGDIKAKWEAFGWKVLECDGHDMRSILETFDEMKRYDGLPICIVANTVKGKGVSFMANVPAWHGIAPNKEEYAMALDEVKAGLTL